MKRLGVLIAQLAFTALKEQLTTLKTHVQEVHIVVPELQSYYVQLVLSTTTFSVKVLQTANHVQKDMNVLK